MQEVRKEEVERLLGTSITDSMFSEALRHAIRKQGHIYQHDGREVVMEHWYLVRLAGEYARNLAFSQFTMDLCQELCNMEKEHLENRYSGK